jgi:two-component system, LuxR family, sensor kinase FixL
MPCAFGSPAYELAPDGYVTLDGNGLIREINLTGAHLLGHERRHLLGARFARFVNEGTRDDFHRFCRRVFESGRREECEVRLVTGDKKLSDVFLSGVAIQDADVNLKQCHVAVTGVTARRIAERWFRKLIETTQDAVVSIDRTGGIELFNRAAEKMFGYSAEEVRGKNVNILMAEPYAMEHQAYVARYERTWEARAIGRIRTVAGRRKNGAVFFIELAVTDVEERGVLLPRVSCAFH